MPMTDRLEHALQDHAFIRRQRHARNLASSDVESNQQHNRIDFHGTDAVSVVGADPHRFGAMVRNLVPKSP